MIIDDDTMMTMACDFIKEDVPFWLFSTHDAQQFQTNKSDISQHFAKIMRWSEGGWYLLSASHPSFLSEEGGGAKLSVLLADLTHL